MRWTHKTQEPEEAGSAYRPALDAYLAGLDRALPAGVVAGVYLIGSVALDDYRPGQSDLDIVTLTARPLTEEQFSALERLHRANRGAQPSCDARYVPLEFVGKLPPPDAPGRAYVDDAGGLGRGGDGDDLVNWAVLDQCGVTVRGPEAALLSPAPDGAELRAWAHGNLESVYRAQSGRLREGIIGQGNLDSSMPPAFAVWMATGAGRLHRTISTGEIISKTRSAGYTAELFPRYAAELARAGASRRGDTSIKYSMRDVLTLIDLVHEVCDSAARLP